MSKTKIEWATEVWNPVTGCTPISEGCQNCYAKRMAQRLKGRFGYPEDEPFRVTFHFDRLSQPRHWKNPRRIFVCSMGDLFHDNVKFYSYRDIVFQLYSNKRHTFFLLTKRPDRMKEIINSVFRYYYPSDWPFPNVYLGVSCENQARADERIPILLQIPAAKRFVSIEPMLGPVDFSHLPESGAELDLVIAGCESGPNRRQAKTQGFRDLKNQCVDAGVPFFLKQMEEPFMFGYQQKRKVVKMPLLDGRIWNQMPKLSRIT